MPVVNELYAHGLKVVVVVFVLAVPVPAGVPSELDRSLAVLEEDAAVRAMMDGRLPRRVQHRADAIERALSKPSTEAWAGVYHAGRLGFTIEVSLAPGEGVTSTWWSCTGPAAAAEGEVESGPDGHLHLRYTEPASAIPPFFPVELVPVRWGARHYLVRPDQLHAFVNAVKLGEEPRDRAAGQFLLRDGGEDQDVEGPPELPPVYARLLSPADWKRAASAFEPRPKGPPPQVRAPVAAKSNGLPRYPREALSAGIGATVTVSLEVTARGTVENVRIVSGPEEFARAVREVAATWRFSPATRDGKRIPWRLVRRLRFSVDS